MKATDKPTAEVHPLALLTDEPISLLDDDRLSLQAFANTVAAVVPGTARPFTIGVFDDWAPARPPSSASPDRW